MTIEATADTARCIDHGEHKSTQRHTPAECPMRPSEHTYLVAFSLLDPGHIGRARVERHLHAALPSSGSRLDPFDPATPQVEEWWVAEDDRQDGSDNASAMFVQKGHQTGELFDRLPDEARATIRAALLDAADYRDDEGGHCADCHDGEVCEDHDSDRARAASYRDLLDLIGA